MNFQHIFKALNEDYVVFGTTRVHSGISWFIMGIVVGSITCTSFLVSPSSYPQISTTVTEAAKPSPTITPTPTTSPLGFKTPYAWFTKGDVTGNSFVRIDTTTGEMKTFPMGTINIIRGAVDSSGAFWGVGTELNSIT